VKKILKKFISAFLIDWYHWILPAIGAVLYRFPSRKMKVIGVAGTDGKTTVTEMISKILEEAGYKIALSNSVRFKIGEEVKINTLRMTMPGRAWLQKFLRQAVDKGSQYAVLEVTSEGIKQYRHKFIDFEVAVLTNLTPEHIEAHGGFENYRAANGKLFQATKNVHIINIDEENVDYCLKFPAKKKYIYGLYQGDINNKDLQYNLKLPGEFNISNALAATGVALSQGISLEICKKALENMEGVPGRMEEVISKPFKVFVDYAVTPAALEKVYQTLKPEKGKMICVLGACGGGRDKWKRPVLGEIAVRYCNEVIITNEDPYDDDPKEIIEQIAEGTKGKAKKFLNRREAIKEALKLAKESDLVVITGKGCESSICLARGKKIPWDDREVVREEFKKIHPVK